MSHCDCGTRYGHHWTECAVYSPLPWLPRTQCWLLGHAPVRIIDASHQERIIVTRGGGFSGGGVEHTTVHSVVDAYHFACRCCGTTLDLDLDTAPLGTRAAMGRDGGAVRHLWIRAGRAARWAYRTRV